MKPYPSLYYGDKLFATATVLCDGAAKAWSEAASKASIVRSNSAGESGLESGRIDFVGIEERARAARSAWIGSKLKAYYETLVRKFERAGDAERENYLGASQCLAELEERIRREERAQSR